MQPDTLNRLMTWFAEQTDGDWEHGRGIRIETLDNPGWRVSIDLAGTSLESVPFDTIQESYEHPVDWMLCRRLGDTFDAACGPTRLADALNAFLAWSSSNSAEAGAS